MLAQLIDAGFPTANAIVSVRCQQLVYEIPSICREILGKLKFAIDNFLKRQIFGLTAKRSFSCQKLEKNATECPKVGAVKSVRLNYNLLEEHQDLPNSRSIVVQELGAHKLGGSDE